MVGRPHMTGYLRPRLRTALAAIAVSIGLIAPGATAQQPAAMAAETEVVAAATANRITVENRRPGTPNWQIPWAGKTVGNDRNHAIKGYASATSVKAGGAIGLHISSQSSYTWHLYRLGHYQGLGGRLVTSGSGAATSQPQCPTARSGMISCQWSRSVNLQTQAHWVSGVYVVVLTAGNYQNYITFVVRDDRPGAIMSLSPTNNYQAYNNYPDDGLTGKSLYNFNSYGGTTVNGTKFAVTVSYDRPYARTGVSDVMRDEVPFIQWAESRGYDMTYATDVDLHANPALASNAQAMWVPGHSEYWTDAMYEASKAAREAGTHQAFMGANNIFWRVRLDPNAAGVANRQMTCWKDQARNDPIQDPARRTDLFRNVGKPEQLILGQMYGEPEGLTGGGDYPWVVTAANGWFYRGTALRNGQSIPGLVGGETDFRHGGIPFPASHQTFVLSQSPTRDRNGRPGFGESSLYKAPSGSWMFDAGTLRYTWGLSTGRYVDPRAEMMTTNLMARQSGFASQVTAERIGGENRYQTAARISARTFEPGVPTVYLAIGTNFPDALAASAATGGDSPVLLVEANSIRPEVEAELARLRPASVKVLGAPETVRDAVLTRARELTGAPTTRIAGSDRYITSSLISRDAFAPGVPVLYISTGLNFPDALAAGAAGAQAGGPVLLTRAGALSPQVLAEVQRLRPGRIVVTGATDAVSDSVVASLRQVAPTTRLAGSNRYITSRLIARDAFSAGSAHTVAVTTGLNFPDALAGGPAVAHAGGGLVLVRDVLDAGAAEEIQRSAPREILFLGTHPTVTNSVQESASRLFDVVNGQATPVVTDPIPPILKTVAPIGPAQEAPAEEAPVQEEPLVEDYDWREQMQEELPWIGDRS